MKSNYDIKWLQCRKDLFLQTLVLIAAMIMMSSVMSYGQTSAVTPDTTGEENVNPAQEMEQNIISSYELNRQVFEQKKKRIKDDVEEEYKELKLKLKQLRDEYESGKASLEEGQDEEQRLVTASYEEKIGIAKEKHSFYSDLLFGLKSFHNFSVLAFTPWAVFLGDIAGVLVFIFLPLTVINLCIFLNFRHKDVFLRHKKALTALIIIVLLASAGSLIAAPLDKRQEVEAKLRYAEKMLSLSGNQKAITILESKSVEVMDLSNDLVSGNSLLRIHTPVGIETPQYYMTLAALYSGEGRVGKAVEAVTQIAEKKGLKGTPSEAIIVSAIKFLVEQGYNDIAGTAIKNHRDELESTQSLLDLAVYLRAHSMETSSSFLMDLARKRTKTNSGFLILARYYFDAGLMDKSRSALTEALKRARNLVDIIEVAEVCVAHKAEGVFSTIPAKEKTLSGTVPQLLRMVRMYSSRGESIAAHDALIRAVSDATNYVELKECFKVVKELELDGVMEPLLEQVINVNTDLSRALNSKEFRAAYMKTLGFVDYLLSERRREDGVKLFQLLVKSIKEDRKKDKLYVALMLSLSQQALERDFKSQAASIVLKVMVVVKPRDKAYSTYVNLHGDKLRSLAGLPNAEKVSIPLYNALIREDIDRLNDAEKVYLQAVIYSLNNINDSQGEVLPKTLNEFYLLGRLWKNENRVNVLSSLDRVYTLLEERLLVQLRDEERQKRLSGLQDEVNKWQKKREEQLAAIKDMHHLREEQQEQKEKELTQATESFKETLFIEQRKLQSVAFKVYLKIFATVVLVLVLSGFFVGITALSWKYSQNLGDHRFYGFITRFVELNGWLRVFSVIGVLSGAACIFTSQLFQILQKIHEVQLKSATQGYVQDQREQDGKEKIDTTESMAQITEKPVTV